MLLAQGETDWWYCINGKATAHFINDTVITEYHWLQSVPDESLQLNSSCISDKNGNFLMWQNGHIILNANLDTMPHGHNLMGSIETSQTLIVPHPQTPGHYYALTTNYTNYYVGLRYSEIDMSLQNGLGDVLIPYNNLLWSPVCQKVTSVNHENGKDIWVLTHEWNSNAFVAFLLTKNGFNTAPVITNIGSVHYDSNSSTGNIDESAGQMKFSPDGKKVAVAIKGMFKVDIFDFNDSTGILSNPITINLPDTDSPSYCQPNSVEFSDDGTILYFVVARPYSNPNLFQVNLLAGDSIGIVNSLTNINNWIVTETEPTLQLAKNGKIYVAWDIYYQQWQGIYNFWVINNPNLIGTDCNLAFYSEDIGNPLPNFHRSLLDHNIIAQNLCLGNSTMIYTLTNTNFDSIRWEFTDIIPFSISNQDTFYHVFSQTGSYQIHLKRYRNNHLDECKKTIYILPVLNVNLINDTVLCKNQTILIQADSSSAQFHWHNSNDTATVTGNQILINEAGSYWFTVSNLDDYCSNLDTIHIGYNLINPELGNNIASICTGNPVLLNTGITDSVNYIWSTGDTIPEISVVNSGEYYVTVSSGYCNETDSVHVQFDQPLSINLQDTFIVCNQDSVLVAAGDATANYHWQPGGQTSSSIYVSQSGTYSVTATNACGQVSDSIEVSYYGAPDIDLGNDTTICAGTQLLLNATWPVSDYLWSDLSTDSTLLVMTTGNYSVRVINLCGIDMDSIYVTFESVQVDLGNDTIYIQSGTSTDINVGAGFESYLWSTGSALPQITVSDQGWYAVTVTDSYGCSGIDSILVIVTGGINETRPNDELDIYPNPTTGLITLMSDCNYDISIFNDQSKEVDHFILNGKHQCDLSACKPGIYFVRAISQQSVITRKLVKL